MVMAFGFLCCHLAPSYGSRFVFALLLLRASSVKHRSYESFGRRGSIMVIGTLPGMIIGSLPGMVIGTLPGMVIGGAAPAWFHRDAARHVGFDIIDTRRCCCEEL
ncbi:hypothetical protein RchiOBHm_Chr3g0483911 [Rosa chinensis]|uniref:Uncharacterized protein n=1 Tax=Rosa chinensis TaxID=74649 RepID=A0A2P6REM9_ROSCH|nr:hypothetical protein RchiOBHm_Chr3g0483911 [Rosa chinensis]